MTPEQQVLAAVRAYYAAANGATQTGDVTVMQSLTVPNCDCKKLADSIRTTYAAGSRFLGARDTITDLKLVSLNPPAASVAIKIHIGAYTLLKPDGTKKQYAAESFVGGIALIKRGSQWLLVSVRGQ
jgi:hypothetical protein